MNQLIIIHNENVTKFIINAKELENVISFSILGDAEKGISATFTLPINDLFIKN